MKPSPNAVLPATVAAAAMIAQQVIGKATRDALFLSHFPVVRLPLAMTAGAVLSALVVLGSSALFARRSPARVVPIAFLLNAVALAFEWGLSGFSEVAAALVVYAHGTAFGASFVSAFWSVVNEAFDPHAARRVIGRIGGGAALGGLVGGAMAWGLARFVTVPSMLLLMAALNLVCLWGVASLRGSVREAEAPPSEQPSGLAALRSTPYLGALALLVLLGATAQTLLDYVIGAEAAATYGKGAALLSFFAVFQTAIGLVSFLLQAAASELALEKLGLAGTLSLMPASVAGFGVLAMTWPSLATAALQRAADGIMRASLFRSAYEILFTPLPQALKRPTKALIDVGFDKIGMVLGSGVTLALLALLPSYGTRSITAAAIVVSLAMLVVAVRMHAGYVTTLADRLRSGVIRVEDVSLVDATTRGTLSRTLEAMDRRTLLAQIEANRERDESKGRVPKETFATSGAAFGDLPAAVDAGDDDPVAIATAALRSDDASVVRAALANPALEVPLVASHVIALLDGRRVSVAREAADALLPHAPRLVGQLVDALVDEQRPAALRRRVARILGHVPTERAASGLVLGLATPQTDVARACARSLAEIVDRVNLDRDTLLGTVQRALGASQIDLAFDVLVLLYPKEPIQLARDALRTQDGYLRGVALEYLDMTLPAELRTTLAPLLDTPAEAKPPVSARAKDAVMEDLLRSKETIRVSLAELGVPEREEGP